MGKRAQVSLVFYDEVLYDQFITPLKKNRELSDVIIKCLSSYYYNADVRSRIDGLEDADSSNEAMQIINDEIKNIQANMQLLDFAINESLDVLDNGSENIKDIMSDALNNKFKDFVTESDDKSTNPRVHLDRVEKFNADAIKAIEDKSNNSNIDKRIDKLESSISDILNYLQNLNNPNFNGFAGMQGSGLNVRNYQQNPNVGVVNGMMPYNSGMMDDSVNMGMQNMQMNVQNMNMQGQQIRNSIMNNPNIYKNHQNQQNQQYQQQQNQAESVNNTREYNPSAQDLIDIFPNQDSNNQNADNQSVNTINTQGLNENLSIDPEKNNIFERPSNGVPFQNNNANNGNIGSLNTTDLDKNNINKNLVNEGNKVEESSSSTINDRNDKLLELVNSAEGVRYGQ